MKHNTLSYKHLREVRSELERERGRFAEHDPRRETYARALGRLDDGSYGTCQGCGTDIPLDRLLAIPETQYCIACGARNTMGADLRQLTPVNGD